MEESDGSHSTVHPSIAEKIETHTHTHTQVLIKTSVKPKQEAPIVGS
jgi:hypothetical protein